MQLHYKLQIKKIELFRNNIIKSKILLLKSNNFTYRILLNSNKYKFIIPTIKITLN